MTEQEESRVSEDSQESIVPTFDNSEVPASSTSALSPEMIAELSKSVEFQRLVERTVQSTKDKRFSKLSKGETAMSEILATLKKEGATIPLEVERDYALKDYINQAVREASAPEDNGMSKGTPKVDGMFDALATIKSLGLDSNDAEVLKLLKGNYRNTDHFTAEARGLALKKTAKPEPSPASLPPLGGGSSSQVTNAEMVAQLAKLQKDPIGNRTQILELEKKLGW